MPKYFATVARGLEALAARELEVLGARDAAPGFAGVEFAGDRELLYRVNLWARLPFRVLSPVAECRCPTAEALHREIGRIDWSLYLDPERTLAVESTGSNRALNHSHFTALQIKNAIVDQQRDRFGRRSSVDIERPDVRVHVHIQGERCLVSLDSSGESLHRRGYRPAMGVAPLKETLAAALLMLAGWQPGNAFADPLCGSGTLPIEAALAAMDTAPGLLRRHFGFQRWPDFDRSLWERLVAEARNRRQPTVQAPIQGSDHDREVLVLARGNAERAGVSGAVCFLEADLATIEPPAASGVLVTNPPYGERLGEASSLGDFYRQLGDTLKQRFRGWRAYVLAGNLELAKRIGLRASRRIPVYNGQIECRLLEYELY